MILSRFSDETYSLSGSKASDNVKRKDAKRVLRAQRGEGREDKIRYRDGQVVSTKGGKFITVETKPDWDGGSRGRVKGKVRGSSEATTAHFEIPLDSLRSSYN